MSLPDVSAIVAAVRRVVSTGRQRVSLHEPEFAGNEWRYLKDCLDSGWVSSAGNYVDLFERRIAEFTGAAHSIVTVNGTSALHVALRLLGVETNDEVIVPTLTFIATANAVAYCGAVPHFADSEVATLGLDAAKLEDHLRDIAINRGGVCTNRVSGRRIRAVVAMHTFGHPVDLDALLELCNRHQLPLVEDAAESLGSYYKAKHTGRFGRIGTLSFNGNKVVTTGGGGALLTDDAELARRAKHITTTARIGQRWSFVHDEIGYNYRMPNLNAALGCAQLERVDDCLQRKRRLFAAYADAVRGIQGIDVVREPEHCRSNYWLNALLLDSDASVLRDVLLDQLNESGIMARPAWTLMHHLQMYSHCPRMDVSVAEDLERRLVNVPSSAFLVGEA